MIYEIKLTVAGVFLVCGTLVLRCRNESHAEQLKKELES